MALIVGAHELTIDSKNRLSIPASLRRKGEVGGGEASYYLTPGSKKSCLALWEPGPFEELRKRVPSPELLPKEARDWRRFEASHTVLVEPDGQGRILIPDRLIKLAGFHPEAAGREVVLFGDWTYIEIWGKAEYEADMAATSVNFDDRRDSGQKALFGRHSTSPSGS